MSWLKRLVKLFTWSEAAKWDAAASAMELEGYTDFAIRLELGPRPQEEA